MDMSLRHELTYGTHKDVPVSLVAASLLANEKLFVESIRLLEDFTEGLDVISLSVRVCELSNGSPLREVLVATLVVTYQKDLVKEVPSLIESVTGVHVPDNLHTLVTVTVVATALYAISSAIERLMPGKSAKSLIDEYQQKLNRMSELSGVDKATIERYTAARVDSNRSLTKRALEFFAPAKLEPGTEILLPDGETVSADVIRELPSEHDLELSDDSDAYELHGAVIDIHRYDRDETKHGWRAVVPSVSDRKVRMELDATINPESLYGKRTIVGDVLVTESRLPNGDMGPTIYSVLRVRDGKEVP